MWSDGAIRNFSPDRKLRRLSAPSSPRSPWTTPRCDQNSQPYGARQLIPTVDSETKRVSIIRAYVHFARGCSNIGAIESIENSFSLGKRARRYFLNTTSPLSYAIAYNREFAEKIITTRERIRGNYGPPNGRHERVLTSRDWRGPGLIRLCCCCCRRRRLTHRRDSRQIFSPPRPRPPQFIRRQSALRPTHLPTFVRARIFEFRLFRFRISERRVHAAPIVHGLLHDPSEYINSNGPRAKLILERFAAVHSDGPPGGRFRRERRRDRTQGGHEGIRHGRTSHH